MEGAERASLTLRTYSRRLVERKMPSFLWTQEEKTQRERARQREGLAQEEEARFKVFEGRIHNHTLESWGSHSPFVGHGEKA